MYRICVYLLILDRRTQSNLSLERVIISQEGFQSAIIKNIVGNKKRPLFLFLKEIRTRNSFFFYLALPCPQGRCQRPRVCFQWN